jgi:hypothetical protein
MPYWTFSGILARNDVQKEAEDTKKSQSKNVPIKIISDSFSSSSTSPLPAEQLNTDEYHKSNKQNKTSQSQVKETSYGNSPLVQIDKERSGNNSITFSVFPKNNEKEDKDNRAKSLLKMIGQIEHKYEAERELSDMNQISNFTNLETDFPGTD